MYITGHVNVIGETHKSNKQETTRKFSLTIQIEASHDVEIWELRMCRSTTEFVVIVVFILLLLLLLRLLF